MLMLLTVGIIVLETDTKKKKKKKKRVAHFFLLSYSLLYPIYKAPSLEIL